jgi:hypothetical protein
MLRLPGRGAVGIIGGSMTDFHSPFVYVPVHAVAAFYNTPRFCVATRGAGDSGGATIARFPLKPPRKRTCTPGLCLHLPAHDDHARATRSGPEPEACGGICSKDGHYHHRGPVHQTRRRTHAQVATSHPPDPRTGVRPGTYCIPATGSRKVRTPLESGRASRRGGGHDARVGKPATMPVSLAAPVAAIDAWRDLWNLTGGIERDWRAVLPLESSRIGRGPRKAGSTGDSNRAVWPITIERLCRMRPAARREPSRRSHREPGPA